MEITNIIFERLNPQESGICAILTLVIDDKLKVHKVKVVNGKKGLFVAFPYISIQNNDNAQERRFIDLVEPTSSAVREELSNLVLNAYKERISEM